MAFMPENAPFVVLTFLGTCFLVAMGLVCIVVSTVCRWSIVFRSALAGTAGMVMLYSGALLLFSWTSRDLLLAPGQPKYFCEIDCHLAYSVEDVKAVDSLGTAPEQIIPQGRFIIAKLKMWFDERTISPHRGNGLLTPNPRWVAVVDENGRAYEPSEAGAKALQETGGPVVPLTQALRPGESVITYLVFDLPKEIKNPRLLVTDKDPITHFLINHEESFFHKKIFFQLNRVEGSSADLGIPPGQVCRFGARSFVTAAGL
ncbi:MAG: hypothetical protein WBN92_14900 [Terriglobia bacterium]